MMLTGQPLHAFDYDKVIAVGGGGRADIHVRAGRENETLELLDGRTIELAPEDIVISSGQTAIGLAGAMGGASTIIDDSTKNIILESATFNLYSLRATQMRHGIFSEAITRFTKGQPAELTAPVLAEAARLMTQYAGARVVTPIAEAFANRPGPQKINISINTINDTLGSKFMSSDAIETLQNIEFTTSVIDQTIIQVTTPYWRSDIHIPEDVIEEIGRLNGFDTIEPTLPLRDFTAVRPGTFDELRTNVRKVLVRAGANEVLSYSFVHGDVLKKASQNVVNSYRITNSISPELQYYRQTLTPSLLGMIHSNVRQGYDDFAIFELNKTHPKQYGLTDERVPVEVDALALVVTSKNDKDESAYYKAKTMLEFLAHSLGLDLIFNSIVEELSDSQSAPFEHRRSALVIDKKTNTYLGIVGEYKRSVTRGFKLPAYTAGFEINTQALYNAISVSATAYTPLSRYPGTERDICFQVEDGISYAQIIDCVNASLDAVALETSVFPIDIYQAKDSQTKNVTVRIRMTAHDRTLTGDEVAKIIANVANVAAEQLSAVIV